MRSEGYCSWVVLPDPPTGGRVWSTAYSRLVLALSQGLSGLMRCCYDNISVLRNNIITRTYARKANGKCVMQALLSGTSLTAKPKHNESVRYHVRYLVC